MSNEDIAASLTFLMFLFLTSVIVTLVVDGFTKCKLVEGIKYGAAFVAIIAGSVAALVATYKGALLALTCFMGGT